MTLGSPLPPQGNPNSPRCEICCAAKRSKSYNYARDGVKMGQCLICDRCDGPDPAHTMNPPQGWSK